MAGIPEEYERFTKMLKVGVTVENVRTKMLGEGYDEETFNKYVNPETAIVDSGGDDDNDDDTDDDDDSDLPTDLDTDTDEFANANGNASGAADPLLEDENDSKSQPNDNAQASADAPPGAQPGEASARQQQQTYIKCKHNFVPPTNQELKLDNLQPVPVKKTLLIVNTFIVNTTAFLNSFLATCETKLHRINTDIQRMETTLSILEGKLTSIEWLRNAQDGILPNVPSAADLRDDFGPDTNAESGAPAAPDAAPPQPSEDPVQSDPEMQQWFRMLKVGVPEQAVRNKMSLAGIDGGAIDRVMQLSKS